MTYFITKVYDIDLEEIVVRDTTTLYSEHSRAYLPCFAKAVDYFCCDKIK